MNRGQSDSTPSPQNMDLANGLNNLPSGLQASRFLGYQPLANGAFQNSNRVSEGIKNLFALLTICNILVIV